MCASEQRSLHTEGAAGKKSFFSRIMHGIFLITRKPVKLEGSKAKLDRSEVMEMLSS